MRLEAHGIAVKYGAQVALRAVDFAVEPGEVVGLIGPNGAGKTTLLRVLANLRRPDAGTVTYDGRDTAALRAEAQAKFRAYLPQNPTVHWPMQAGALVELGRLPHRRMLGSLTAEDRAAVERALAAADVAVLRMRTLGEVSAGERMRILLARALAVEAQVLLADEPTAALDPLHQIQVMELLRATTRARRSVVVVLHDLSLATRFCDRLVLLADNGVLAQGTPREVLTDANLARAYGVEMLRGERDGIQYFVPWKAVD
jgi:iron complex transport system ATP-binding protein